MHHFDVGHFWPLWKMYKERPKFSISSHSTVPVLRREAVTHQFNALVHLLGVIVRGSLAVSGTDLSLPLVCFDPWTSGMISSPMPSGKKNTSSELENHRAYPVRKSSTNGSETWLVGKFPHLVRWFSKKKNFIGLFGLSSHVWSRGWKVILQGPSPLFWDDSIGTHTHTIYLTLYIYVYMYVRTYVRTYVCVWVCVCVYVYSVYVCVYIYIIYVYIYLKFM